ncbi:MAG: hypothetical protein Q7U75_13855, partial [Desulfobacterales bacterium]|nr:hypothetical protein [Desulfobacterales bacterium]
MILAVAILLLVAAGVIALVRRSNPHLESLISDDPVTGCLDDDFRRGELEAAGADAVPFLREQLR